MTKRQATVPALRSKEVHRGDTLEGERLRLIVGTDIIHHAHSFSSIRLSSARVDNQNDYGELEGALYAYRFPRPAPRR